jgi:HD superfamily phosphohydrolase
VDQLDYLIRDAYYTGVSYGLIDIERFLQTLTISKNNLVIKKKGIGSVENIIMARALMYSSVYFHKTVRIAELMLSKAIEMLAKEKQFDFYKTIDAELINELKKIGKFQNKIVTCLKYRNLFKQSFSASELDLNQEQIKIVKSLNDIKKRREKEKKFEQILKIPPGHIIIDVPYKDLHLAEPRINQTNIMILDDDSFKKMDEFTPIAKAVRTKIIPEWNIMIITENKYRNIVSKKAKKILFN